VNNEKPREIACAILARAEEREVYLDLLLADQLPRLSGPDRALCQEIVYGITRWKALLDWIITERTGGRTQKEGILHLLRLGIYQLFWLDRVPDHAVVNETVALARRRGFEPQSGFVNALLRGCIRDREALRQSMENLRAKDPALGRSHPRWLVERWIQRWGRQQAIELMDWDNRPAPIYARVNTLRVDAGTLVERWRLDEKVDYDFMRFDWIEENRVFRLSKHPPLTSIPSFRDGGFYVQDPSTLLAVNWLDAQPGDRILDLCAAPGGKATAMAQQVANQALIVARDTSPRRLALVQDNCRRLGVTCVETELLRPDAPAAKSSLRFDRALVDAPCSNTGVLRRRVEARWRIREDDLQRLFYAQRDLLGQAAEALNPGGTLVYSTCSLEPEENQEVVRSFLNKYSRFRLERERELLPFRDGVDGAYVALLRRAA
jgi:16S rRNA (cytosine967-C5)-methyltransferase